MGEARRADDPDRVRDALREALAADEAGDGLDLPERAASVAVVLHPCEVSLSMLWIRRAENPRDPWSGQMGFPGGRRDPGDPSTRATAERETLEEIGLCLVSAGEYLGELASLPARSRRGAAGFRVVPHVYWVPELPPFELDAVEVAEAVSISLPHLLDPTNASKIEYEWEGMVFRLPAIDHGERKLWGLSYKILQDFLGRLERAGLTADLAGRDGAG